jgi:protein gp37
VCKFKQIKVIDVASKTNIEWTDFSWNVLRGCSRVSEGCRNCYAESVANRFKGPGQPYEGLIAVGGQWNGKIRVVDHLLNQPLRWRKPRRIFVNSMSDLFHENVPFDEIYKIMMVMQKAKHHSFQVLTKRPDRMLEFFRSRGSECMKIFADVMPNVWLGVSVEDQAAADERIPLLMQTPAAVRWLSIEPLLGPLDLTAFLGASGIGRNLDALSNAGVNPGALIPSKIDWVVVGGESGANARPMHPSWARALRDQCQAAGVPYFFKQWGEWRPICQGESQEVLDELWGRHCTVPKLCLHNNGQHTSITGPGAWQQSTAPVLAFKVGKKAAGRQLDGREWNEYPGQEQIPNERH